MKPAPFDLARPRNLAEALAVLAERGDEARGLAGGQSLVPLMNLRLSRPATLVDLNPLAELAYIRPHDGGLAIGALTRQRAIEASSLVRERSPLLAEVTPFIGHPAIRSRGTLGGSLAHADPAAEYPAAVLALDGAITVARGDGHRVLPAEAFFRSYLATACGPGELVTEVTLPRLPPRTGTAFLELTRRHGDFAIVGVAAVVTLDEEGRVSRARIVLAGVGPTPLRARPAEVMLQGERPHRELLVEVGRAAAAVADPADDLHGTAEYRREMCAVFTRRALTRALERLSVAI